ncbi:AAA family ATPase [Ahrensia sp. 13_GOM-1096m]|uniref:AAA family ATPase n=1 Tax=Ahrensia sp. 13_GOM-1096m TaxID=1380380 RepID=UPI00047EE968|nr:AAA family ATPase [Ahrensia sp. 13_GOM-1096m]
MSDQNKSDSVDSRSKEVSVDSTLREEGAQKAIEQPDSAISSEVSTVDSNLAINVDSASQNITAISTHENGADLPSEATNVDREATASGDTLSDKILSEDASKLMLSQPRKRFKHFNVPSSGAPFHELSNGRTIDFRTYRLVDWLSEQSNWAAGSDASLRTGVQPQTLAAMDGRTAWNATDLNIKLDAGDPLAMVSDLVVMLCNADEVHPTISNADWNMAAMLLNGMPEADTKRWGSDSALAASGIRHLWCKAASRGERWILDLADRLLVPMIYETRAKELILMAIDRVRADDQTAATYLQELSDTDTDGRYGDVIGSKAPHHANKIAMARLLLHLLDSEVANIFDGFEREAWVTFGLYRPQRARSSLVDVAGSCLFDDIADAVRTQLINEGYDLNRLFNEGASVEVQYPNVRSMHDAHPREHDLHPDADTNADEEYAIFDHYSDEENGQGDARIEDINRLDTKSSSGEETDILLNLPVDPRRYETLADLLYEQVEIASMSNNMPLLSRSSNARNILSQIAVKAGRQEEAAAAKQDASNKSSRIDSFQVETDSSPIAGIDTTQSFRLSDGHEVAIIMPNAPASIGGSDAQSTFEQIKPLIGAWLPLTKKPDLVIVRSHLMAEFPHFENVIDAILNTMRAQNSVRMPPILLTGKPGSGKSTFARRLAHELQTHHVCGDIGGSVDAMLLGSSRKWHSAAPGLHFQAIIDGSIANPMIILDELDKAGGSTRNGDIRANLLSMLEPSTASSTIDKYFEVPINYGCINWIFTANDLASITAPLLNRLKVLKCHEPSAEHMPIIANNILKAEYESRGYDSRWATPLSIEELDIIQAHWLSTNAGKTTMRKTKGSIRNMKRYVERLIDIREQEMRQA